MVASWDYDSPVSIPLSVLPPSFSLNLSLPFLSSSPHPPPFPLIPVLSLSPVKHVLDALKPYLVENGGVIKSWTLVMPAYKK